MQIDKELLIEKALEARKMSYSPYSHFQVGAAILTESGKIYTGAKYPCGICRQFLREFALPDMAVYIKGPENEIKETTLSELLPDSFGPEHLG